MGMDETITPVASSWQRLPWRPLGSQHTRALARRIAMNMPLAVYLLLALLLGILLTVALELWLLS